jgi:peroxiredoxin Q/BCP
MADKEQIEEKHPELKVGDKIPPFLAKDHEGFDVTDEDVIGTPLVIYFYPKDGTPICTDEACAFRDSMAKFDEKQALVLGVSPDGVDSHKSFLTQQKLEFSLLSDEKKDMFRSFGAMKGDDVVRATYVVNSEGEVKWMEKPVDIKGHVERVLKALEEHCSEEIVSFDDYDRDYEEFMGKSLGEAPDEEKIRADILKKFNLKESDLKEK